MSIYSYSSQCLWPHTEVHALLSIKHYTVYVRCSYHMLYAVCIVIMDQYLMILLVAVVWLKIPLTASQSEMCSKTLNVGIGYDLIKANPQEYPDPGLKRTRKILRVTFPTKIPTKAKQKNIFPQMTYCTAPQVVIEPVTLCSYEEETRFFAGTASYRSELELNIKLTGNAGNTYTWTVYTCKIHGLFFFLADFGLSSFSFSGSNGKPCSTTETRSLAGMYTHRL